MSNSYFNNATFYYTQAAWTQPSVPGDSRYTDYQAAPDASFWDGLGISYLIQAGADSIATATPTYRFWTEDYPQGTVWEGPSLNPGDHVWVWVKYNGNNTATYYLEDTTTGHYSSFTNSAPFVGNRAGNFINEKLGDYLPQFSTSPAFSDCATAVAGSSQAYLLQSTNNDVVIMTTTGKSSGTVESHPGSVNNSTGGFDVTWENF